MSTDSPDRPLVGEHPYVGAAREHAHPSPTGDAQTVADLDRLQLAERALAAAMAAGGVGAADLASTLSPMRSAHDAHATELAERMRELGGAPSDGGDGDLPDPASRISDLADGGAIGDALRGDLAMVAGLYRGAIARMGDGDPDRARLTAFEAACRRDADRLPRTA